jgi:hypothetical protein
MWLRPPKHFWNEKIATNIIFSAFIPLVTRADMLAMVQKLCNFVPFGVFGFVLTI